MEHENSPISIDFNEMEKLIVSTAKRLNLSEDETDELRQNSWCVALEQRNEWLQTLQLLVWSVAMKKEYSVRSNKQETRSLTEEDEENLLLNDVRVGELDMFDKIMLADDVQKVIESLPPDRRELCELLKHYSVRSVCKRLNIRSDTELIRRCELLRPVFIKAGFY